MCLMLWPVSHFSCLYWLQSRKNVTTNKTIHKLHYYDGSTCVFESGRSHGRVPLRRSSAILAFSLWARIIVSGMHSSVSSVAYPNIKPYKVRYIRSSHYNLLHYKPITYSFIIYLYYCQYWPGPQLQCPPHYDQCEHLEQYQETAVPRPQARCRSYNQTLHRRRSQINTKHETD